MSTRALNGYELVLATILESNPSTGAEVIDFPKRRRLPAGVPLCGYGLAAMALIEPPDYLASKAA